MWYDTLAENKTYNFKYVFEDLKSIMKRSHINFYSQQSIIGGKDLGLSAYYNYNSPTDVGDAMTDIGFNMVSLANYHAFDKKIKGIENSIKYWTDKNVAYSGTSISEETRNKNNIINKNGVKVGLLSYTMGTDEVYKGTYEINIYSDEQAKKDINDLKDKVDIVVVSIDWGNVGKIEVTDKQKQTATYLSELGADIIVGNTGYSIQTIEKINNTIVFYSLGNLLSGHTMVDSRISAVIDFKVNLTEKEDERKIEFKNIKVLLTYAYNNDNTDYKVIPFNKLDKELKNYKTYYDKYTEILTKNEKDLSTWTNICQGVYATFGDSLPIEGLTEAANETAKTGSLTGVLADALNWAGVSEDTFQASLDACNTEAEREQLIRETLNGLYADAALKYEENNAKILA